MDYNTIGYARKLGTDIIGDVGRLTSGLVSGTLHKSQKRFSWHLGKGKVELIEFGSFNRENDNYVSGGKVIAIK